MTKKKNCPTFTGEHGIESLLYVEERFRAVSRQLEYNTGEELFEPTLATSTENTTAIRFEFRRILSQVLRRGLPGHNVQIPTRIKETVQSRTTSPRRSNGDHDAVC